MDPSQYTDSYAGYAFASPTGNIICYIDPDLYGWGCLIEEHSYTEPAGAEECVSEFGNGFSSVQGSRPEPLCRGGVVAEAEDGTGAILPYEHTLTVGPVTCLSQEHGVTCVDERSRYSLFISRQMYQIS